MLILSRKPDQSIRIGNEVTIRVLKVKGNTIQLGIEAPRDVRILRSELTAAEDSQQLDSLGQLGKLPQPSTGCGAAESPIADHTDISSQLLEQELSGSSAA